MRYFNFLFVVLLSGFLVACSSNEKNTTSTTTTNTPSTTTTTPNTQTSQTNTSSNPLLTKVGTVDQPSGKKMAPNFTWTESGKSASLNDLKGNVVFVNFWATWCGPCKKEMPDLSAISQELKDKNFKMIGVNVFQQEGGQTVEDFLSKSPVSYLVVDGNEQMVNAFSTADGQPMEAVPTTFIIDKDGKIVETIIGSRSKADFLKLINKYLS